MTVAAAMPALRRASVLLAVAGLLFVSAAGADLPPSGGMTPLLKSPGGFIT